MPFWSHRTAPEGFLDCNAARSLNKAVLALFLYDQVTYVSLPSPYLRQVQDGKLTQEPGRAEGDVLLASPWVHILKLYSYRPSYIALAV